MCWSRTLEWSPISPSSTWSSSFSSTAAPGLHRHDDRQRRGVKVRITTPAKTVADCFRFRRHVGLEVALAALKDYLRKRKGSIDTLVAAARADRIYALMRPYLEALA